MDACKIEKIEDSGITLKFSGNNKQKVVFEFYGYTPQINDILCLDERILRPSLPYFCVPLAFEVCKERRLDLEHIEIKRNEKILYLKRVYG